MELGAPIVDLSQIAQGTRDAGTARATRAMQGRADPQGVREAAEEFEAVFLAQMLAPMFEGLKTDEMFGGGPGEDIYRSVLVEEYGKAIARSGGVGIADAVQRELLNLQEARSQ